MRRAVRSGSRAHTSATFSMARSARLVATGCWRTNALVLATKQHKYCDHGLSVVVLTSTWPIFFSRLSCTRGGPSMKASIFPSARSCLLSIERSGKTSQLMSLVRVEAHVGGEYRDEDLTVASQPADPHSLPLQF